MNEFSHHPLFFLLEPDLRFPAVAALQALFREWVYEGPDDMYDDVRQQVHDGVFIAGLRGEADTLLRLWVSRTPSAEFVAALSGFFWTKVKPYVPPRATEAQLRIITEYQQERGMDVDFTPCFPLLTTNGADLLCKGLVVVSEILRSTGQRRLHPRDVRQAIRRYLAENPNVVETPSPHPDKV